MRKQAKTVTFCITGALDKMRRVDAIQLVQNETNARWISEEHALTIAPTLRKEVSFAFVDVLNDLQIIFLLLMAFFDIFIFIYFLINLISSIILISFHLRYAHKYMNVYAHNHREKHLQKNK